MHNKPTVGGWEDHLRLLFNGKHSTQLLGITSYKWFQLYKETDQDIGKCKSEEQLTSRLGLYPGQKPSGKIRRSKSKGKPIAGRIFRNIAQSLLQNKRIALGELGRRVRARKSASVAIKQLRENWPSSTGDSWGKARNLCKKVLRNIKTA